MHLHDVPGNRKSQAEAAVFAREPAVALAEALEDVRKEFVRDADAGIGDDDVDVAVVGSRWTVTSPPFGVNFTAFDRMFHITCCSRSGSPMTCAGPGSITACRAMPLASAAG